MYKLYGGMGKLQVAKSSNVCKPIGHTLQESIVIKHFPLEKLVVNECANWKSPFNTCSKYIF